MSFYLPRGYRTWQPRELADVFFFCPPGLDWRWKASPCRLIKVCTGCTYLSEEDPDLKVYSAVDENLGGLPARVIVAWDENGKTIGGGGSFCASYVVGAHWTSEEWRNSISIVATAKTPTEVGSLLGTIRSMEFHSNATQ